MNHYEVLGIKKTASQNEIREAYKKLVKKYHPDLYQGDKTFAEKKTQSINAAYETLSDPELRKKYDDEITPKTYTTSNSSDYKYNTNYYNQRNTNNSSSAYSYDNYKRNNYNQYSSNNDFYQRRYSNYHRSKVPNSNYTNYSRSRNNKSFFELIFKTGKQQIIAIVVIFIIYLVTLFSNINDYSLNYKNSKNEIQKSTNSINDDSYDRFYSEYKNFDINDYYTDSELYDEYKNHYYDKFDSFEDFKEEISRYMFLYIYNN